MEKHNQLTGRNARTFMLLCAMVYFTSYLTRTNYTAVILELTGALGITKSEAGLISTIAFFTYGAGQLVSGFVGDKIYPRRLIAFGLAATSVCNFLMSACGSIAPMAVIWGVNGLCQAMFWPPLVRLMAENLNDDNYSTACVWVSVGSSFGTIGVYLACPLLIKLGGWRLVFIAAGICGVLMTALWLIASGKLLKNRIRENVRTDDDEAPAATGGIGAAGFGVLAAVCLAIVLQGILRDGVTTWMPVLVSEQFGLPTGASILTGLALPVFSMISFNLAGWLQKKLHSEMICSILLFGVAAGSALVLRIFGFSGNKSVVTTAVSVLLMSVLTGCMHGINLMLVSRIPSYFMKFGRISTISGVVNAFTYVGSAISSFWFAALTERAGWGVTVSSWLIIALAGCVVCVVIRPVWEKYKREKLS